LSINNNNVKIDLEINGELIESDNFDGITIINSINLTIPTAIIKLKLVTNKLKNYLSQASKLSVKIKYSDKFISKYEFFIQNIDLTKQGYLYAGNLSCILYVPSYIQGLKQDYFEEKSSKKVFDSIDGVDVKVMYEDEDDIQTWLRYNITQKEFCEYIYKHTFIKDDLVLGAILPDKTMKLRKVSKIILDKKKVDNTDKADINISQYSFRTNFDIISYKLSPTRIIQFFDVLDHQINTKYLDNKSFITKKEYNEMLTYKPNRIFLDCKNTFDDYLFTYQKNMIQRRMLNNYEIEFSTNYQKVLYSDDDLNVLDGIDFKYFESDRGLIDKTLAGIYIITKRVIDIKGGSITQTYTASRDFYNKG
jgi:hypothetical protein